MTTSQQDHVRLHGAADAAANAILTPEALAFVTDLERRFGDARRQLLAARQARQELLDHGQVPDFLPETRAVREAAWTIAPLPRDLQDRRVEITGPVDRKMVINALNSGASAYMADFEDSNSPTFANCVNGQKNLYDAVRRNITYRNASGKKYRLNDPVATLIVRPRGWHLEERHFEVDGRPVSASLFDFGLFLFHNARALMDRGSGPYFYLPKLESHHEARLWNDVFLHAQDALDIPVGTIKATVLIETVLAAFEMHEILYELRDHSAGLNCGRWDYIFSFIKKLHGQGALLPDRAEVTMTRHFLKSYSELVIQTCHRRGAHAIGGMAAQIPIKHDPEANAAALARVRADKEREAAAGHDGTWVAHPALVPIAREVFDRLMPGPNQIERLREDVEVRAADLLKVPAGAITERGLRTNVSVGLRYLEAWLRGTGCVPIDHLMEDAATAEISRAQLWQWIHHPDGCLDSGEKVTLGRFRKVLEEELAWIENDLEPDEFAASRFADAARLYDQIIAAPTLVEFLTLPAYDVLCPPTSD